MAYNGVQYKYKYKDEIKTKPTTKLSVIEFVKKELKDYRYDIIKFSKEKIRREEIKDAWKKIQEINGVSEKISSFFLRDIVVLFEKEINLHNIRKERKFLQPIDIWVRRWCEYLNKRKLTDDKCKEFIVKPSLENEINPEKVNMGMWSFASQILGSNYELLKVLKNESEDAIADNMKKEIQRYVDRVGSEIKVLSRI